MVIEIVEDQPLSSSSSAAAMYTPAAALLESMSVSKVDPNPYKMNGPDMPVAVWEPAGVGYVKVRLDMPGVNTVDVKGLPHENRVEFKGFEQKITMHGIGKENEFRVYEGVLEFDPQRFPKLDFGYGLSNGVLSFRFRCKGPPRRGDLGVTLKAKLIEARNDITVDSVVNPLVSTGRDRYCLHGFKDKAFIFAVDMPGIGEHDKVSLSVKREFVNFYAQDTTTQGSYGESEDEERREYDGYFKVSLLDFDTSQVQYEIVHGVLWILVPRKVKPLREVVTLLHGVQTEGVFE